MKQITLNQMEMVEGGMTATQGVMCGLTVVGWGLSLASLIMAPNPISAIGYSVSTAGLASCFV